MIASGTRKAALYMASLAGEDRRVLLDALPRSMSAVLRPMIAQVVANGWNAPELVARALAEEIPVTSHTALPVDTVLALAKSLPPDWAARVLAANATEDPRFLLGLLEPLRARAVQAQLEPVRTLPERLREAVLLEAAACVRRAA